MNAFSSSHHGLYLHIDSIGGALAGAVLVVVVDLPADSHVVLGIGLPQPLLQGAEVLPQRLGVHFWLAGDDSHGLVPRLGAAHL